jgi:hypothetical protein
MTQIKQFSSQSFHTWHIPSPCHPHYMHTSPPSKFKVIWGFWFKKNVSFAYIPYCNVFKGLCKSYCMGIGGISLCSTNISCCLLYIGSETCIKPHRSDADNNKKVWNSIKQRRTDADNNKKVWNSLQYAKGKREEVLFKNILYSIVYQSLHQFIQTSDPRRSPIPETNPGELMLNLWHRRLWAQLGNVFQTGVIVSFYGRVTHTGYGEGG